jgi:hypothetical protein
LDQATAALGGAFIGASAGIAGGVALEMYKRRRDRQGTASALAGEIASILYMTNRRGHVEYFEALLPTLDGGDDVSIPILAPSGDHRDPVADRYIDRLGLLPSNCAERIVRFYTLLAGVRADVRRLSSDEFKGNPSAMAALIKENLLVWKEATRLGDQLLTELRKIAAPHRRVRDLEVWTEARWLGRRIFVHPRKGTATLYQRIRNRLRRWLDIAARR